MRLKIRITIRQWLPEWKIFYLQLHVTHINASSEDAVREIARQAAEYVKKNFPKAEIFMVENLGEDNILVEQEQKQ
jgi:hypothetical protein